ncbi:hypothetical protein GW7_06237 [Heterocephalus glaber]|uniref:Uncharacterized protein n=1 Tax=Heterocephalus glaber TaxID=10181 RepID=G5B3D5_HETGA|nr:hypothetical protein GW7_06237 [Heterocephalus glaber]
MTLSLQEEAVARGSFEVAFPAAAEKMKRAILQLKKVQPCIPPCGEGAGDRAASGDVGGGLRCDPVSSVQDVTVGRGDQAMFSCVVGFPLAEEEIAYSWSFAGGGVSRGAGGRLRGVATGSSV